MSAIEPLKEKIDFKAQAEVLGKQNAALRKQLDERLVDQTRLNTLTDQNEDLLDKLNFANVDQAEILRLKRENTRLKEGEKKYANLERRNKELEDTLNGERNELENIIVENNAAILDAVEYSNTQIEALTTKFNDMANQITALAQSSKKFDDTAKSLKTGIDDISGLVQLIPTPPNYSKGFKGVNENVKAIGDTIGGLRESIDNNSKRVGGLETQMKENRKANAVAIKSLNDVNIKIEAERNNTLTDWTNEIKEAVEARDRGIAESVRAIAEKKDHKLDLGPVQESIKTISDSVDEIRESVANYGKTVAESSKNEKSLADELRQEGEQLQKSQQGEHRTAEEAAARLEKTGKECEKLLKESAKREKEQAALIERIEKELPKTKTNATKEIERLEKNFEAKAIGEVKKEIEAARVQLEQKIEANNPKKAIEEVKKEIKDTRNQLDSVLKKIGGAINDGAKFGDIERAIKKEFKSLQTKINGTKEPDLAKAIEAALRKVLKEQPELAVEVKKSLDVLRGFIN